MKAILTLFLVLLVAALGRLSDAESPRGPTHAPVHGPAVNAQGTATEPRASGVTTARVSGTVIDVPPPEPVVRQRMGVAVRLRHADGSIMRNCRDNRGGSRTVAVTRDLGATWQLHPTDRQALPDGVCMASLVALDVPGVGRRLLFSNPATTTDRQRTLLPAAAARRAEEVDRPPVVFRPAAERFEDALIAGGHRHDDGLAAGLLDLLDDAAVGRLIGFDRADPGVPQPGGGVVGAHAVISALENEDMGGLLVEHVVSEAGLDLLDVVSADGSVHDGNPIAKLRGAGPRHEVDVVATAVKVGERVAQEGEPRSFGQVDPGRQAAKFGRDRLGVDRKVRVSSLSGDGIDGDDATESLAVPLWNTDLPP